MFLQKKTFSVLSKDYILYFIVSEQALDVFWN